MTPETPPKSGALRAPDISYSPGFTRFLCKSRGHMSFFRRASRAKYQESIRVYNGLLPIKGAYVIFPGALRAQNVKETHSFIRVFAHQGGTCYFFGALRVQNIKKQQGFTRVFALVIGFNVTMWSAHRIPRICKVL